MSVTSRLVYVSGSQEPVSLAEVRQHLRIDADDTSQDVVMQALIAAARDHVEQVTRSALGVQTWQWIANGFPDEDTLALGKPPLTSVTSITYVDTNGATQTWAASNYVVWPGLPGQVRLAYDASWPSVREQPASVTVTFEAGYTAATLPPSLRAAILLLVGHWFEQRQAVVTGTIATEVPLTVQALVGPYRYLEAV